MSFIGSTSRDIAFNFIGNDRVSGALRSIDSSTKRATRSAGLLAKTLRVAALAAATALAAAAAVAARFLWNATKAAYADDIAMKKLAFTQMKAQDATKAQTQATSDLIDRLELATGIADDEMRPAMAALAGTGMEVKKSQDLLNLALDISVARGKSVQTVSEALAKAYNGQLTGLQRLGVKVTDASGDALSFSEVLKNLEKRFGGAARAAGKTAALERLTAAWNQSKEALGKAFLPLLRKFANFVQHTVVPWVRNHLVDAFRSMARWIREDAIPWLKKLHDKFSEPGGFYDTVKDTWQKVLDLAGALGVFVGAISGKGKGEGAESSTTTIGDAMTGLAEAIGDAAEALQGLLDKISTLESKTAVVQKILSWGSEGSGTGGFSWFKDNVLNPPEWWPGDADGGWLKKRAMGGRMGRLTLVGEHGPELIDGRGFVKTHSQSMGMGNAPVVINVNGAIDPVMTARQIERILAKGRRVTGAGGLATA